MDGRFFFYGPIFFGDAHVPLYHYVFISDPFFKGFFLPELMPREKCMSEIDAGSYIITTVDRSLVAIKNGQNDPISYNMIVWMCLNTFLLISIFF